MEAIKAIFADKKPVKWLFYGDSITHGAVHTWGERDYTQLFAERVRYEMGRSMDIVINTAISGHNTGALLDGFEWRVKQFNPDVVFVMIGMNDCSTSSRISCEQFERNLHALADRIIEGGGKPVMQTTCPILPGTSPDRLPHFPAFMDAIRRVAADRKLPLVDHTAHWEANNGKLYYWLDNPFHPNGHGHRAFANLLFKELGIFDPASATCRLFVP